MYREFSKKKFKWPVSMKSAQLSGKYKLKQDHLFPSDWQKFRSLSIPSPGGIVGNRWTHTLWIGVWLGIFFFWKAVWRIYEVFKCACPSIQESFSLILKRRTCTFAQKGSSELLIEALFRVEKNGII